MSLFFMCVWFSEGKQTALTPQVSPEYLASLGFCQACHLQ